MNTAVHVFTRKSTIKKENKIEPKMTTTTTTTVIINEIQSFSTREQIEERIKSTFMFTRIVT